jgi:hypothetical protein
MCISLGILFPLLSMNAAIHLDNQVVCMTIKINDKPINDLLAAKMPASEFIRPQFMPEKRLFTCHILAQLFGTLAFFDGYLLPNNYILDWHMHLLPFPCREGAGG